MLWGKIHSSWGVRYHRGKTCHLPYIVESLGVQFWKVSERVEIPSVSDSRPVLHEVGVWMPGGPAEVAKHLLTTFLPTTTDNTLSLPIIARHFLHDKVIVEVIIIDQSLDNSPPQR
jgi:hypothetical protein